MSRDSRSQKALPDRVSATLVKLGKDLSIARRRRSIPQRVLAERLLVNRETVARMEAGDPTVAIGMWATAAWLFGMEGRLGALMASRDDVEALALDLDRLPEHAHEPARDMMF